jgi:hypothetical protein
MRYESENRVIFCISFNATNFVVVDLFFFLNGSTALVGPRVFSVS